MSIVKEFWQFLLHRKLMWMAPIIIILAALSIFIFLTEGSALVPFIYAVF
jgi:hypothetical protein